jgi:hypothetical protein
LNEKEGYTIFVNAAAAEIFITCWLTNYASATSTPRRAARSHHNLLTRIPGQAAEEDKNQIVNFERYVVDLKKRLRAYLHIEQQTYDQLALKDHF